MTDLVAGTSYDMGHGTQSRTPSPTPATFSTGGTWDTVQDAFTYASQFETSFAYADDGTHQPYVCADDRGGFLSNRTT